MLTGWEELSNVLTVGLGLFCEDFEFVADIILVVSDPVLYIWFRFCE